MNMLMILQTIDARTLLITFITFLGHFVKRGIDMLKSENEWKNKMQKGKSRGSFISKSDNQRHGEAIPRENGTSKAGKIPTPKRHLFNHSWGYQTSSLKSLSFKLSTTRWYVLLRSDSPLFLYCALSSSSYSPRCWVVCKRIFWNWCGWSQR